MKAARFAAALAILLSAVMVVAGDTPTKASSANGVAFEKIKSLAGSWQGKAPNGTVFSLRVRVISAGSAVVMEPSLPGEGDMITVFHPDGADLIATHYCAAKNQPRYVLTPSSDPNTLTFKFKDATNLASPEAGHMHGVVIQILDGDHHRETWTWRQDGKEKAEVMEFARVK